MQHLIVVEADPATCGGEFGSIYDLRQDRWVGCVWGTLRCRRMGSPLSAPLIDLPMLYAPIKDLQRIWKVGAEIHIEW